MGYKKYFPNCVFCKHGSYFLTLVGVGNKLIDGNKIQCPWHHPCFDIQTGAVIEWANYPPGIQLMSVVRREKVLTAYKATVGEGNLLVDVQA